MIIVKIQGGLGNQMFQYVLAQYLMECNKNVKLDIEHYSRKSKGKSDTIHQGYELEKIFEIDGEYASQREIYALGSEEKDVFHKVIKRAFGRKRTHIMWTDLGKRQLFFPELKQRDDVYLEGTWNTFRYADEIREKILNKFEFKPKLNSRNQQIAFDMEKQNAVSIHVRHGDYMNLQNKYNILTLEYYKQAIQYIKDHVEQPVFYCFSDDNEWCKKNLGENNMIYIDWNTEENSYQDMQLMSLCKHNIVANSTFSMWGAWLNSNPEKIVIRPSKVFTQEHEEYIDMWPQEWIPIKG